MPATLPVELAIGSPDEARAYPRARAFLLARDAEGAAAPADAAIHLPLGDSGCPRSARSRGFIPEFPAARLAEATAALRHGATRLALDARDDPPALAAFLRAGGSVRFIANTARIPGALLADPALAPKLVTLDAASLPGSAHGRLIAAAYLCGAALLARPGITLRLPGDSAAESWSAARETLASCGEAVPGVTLVACPTCARASLDIVALAERIHARTRAIAAPLTVAVMGCEVNGPGEARHADLGVAGGRDRGLLFRRGEPLRTVPPDELEEALVALIEEATGERCLPPSTPRPSPPAPRLSAP